MFHQRLKSARIRANLSQSQLAQIIGVSRDLYNKYERTSTRPSYETLIKIARALETPVDELLSGLQLPVPALGPDEEELLSLYRSLNTALRQEALIYLRQLIQRSKVDALLERLDSTGKAVAHGGSTAAVTLDKDQQALIREILQNLDDK